MIGLRLHNYEVVSVLGEGGMGTVYLARHTYMGRRAAIKFLRPEMLQNESVVARFLDESRATNAIRHPGIIDIIDVGLLSDGRTPYLMMEFLDGESLCARMGRSRPLPIHEAVEIACQTASALGAAHAAHIVHRDLKPDNLFLVPDRTLPTRTRVKVLDFGIAKLRVDMRGEAVRTQTGAIMGTVQYMSPEQCRGHSAAIDHRTDVYSLGIILYEMLCGQVPFVSEGLGEIILMHITAEPPPLRERVPEIPALLEQAVLRALAKDPAQRFDSMASFARAIRAYDPQAALTAPEGWDEPAPEPEVAATMVARSLTPPPVLIPSETTPLPVLVPVGASVPATVVVPSASPPSARPGTALDAAPRIGEPTWIPRASSVGAHTTLSSHTGQMKPAPPGGASRRRWLIGAVVGVGAVVAVLAMALLRGDRGKPSAAPPPTALSAPVVVPPLATPPATAPLAPTAPPAAASAPAASERTTASSGRSRARRHRSTPSVAAPAGKAPEAPKPAVVAPPPPAVPVAGPRGGKKW